MAPRPNLATILSICATVFVAVYYATASNFIPTSIILITAAQVLFQGALAVNDLLLHLLGHIALRRPLPLDLLSLCVLQFDARSTRTLSLPFLFLNAFISLFLIHTPDVLLTAFATNALDIRTTSARTVATELASFGGGFDRTTYYTAGLVLLASTDPPAAYLEVAHQLPLSQQWVVPRKPVLWYRVFSQKLLRESDLEYSLYASDNDAVILTPLPAGAVPSAGCQMYNRSDFGYSLAATFCGGGVIGFEVSGPTLPDETRHFRLTKGVASVQYSSRRNRRRIEVSRVRDEEGIAEFPRHADLMRDMHRGFLNVISFNRAPSLISVTERLALSSLVRAAGLEEESGFSEPPRVVNVKVWDVRISEVSRWLLLVMTLSVGMMVVAGFVFALSDKVLSRELAQWMQLGRGLTGAGVFSAYPRSRRKEEVAKWVGRKISVKLIEDKGLKFQLVDEGGNHKVGHGGPGDVGEFVANGLVATASGAIASALSDSANV